MNHEDEEDGFIIEFEAADELKELLVAQQKTLIEAQESMQLATEALNTAEEVVLTIVPQTNQDTDK